MFLITYLQNQWVPKNKTLKKIIKRFQANYKNIQSPNKASAHWKIIRFPFDINSFKLSFSHSFKKVEKNFDPHPFVKNPHSHSLFEDAHASLVNWVELRKSVKRIHNGYSVLSQRIFLSKNTVIWIRWRHYFCNKTCNEFFYGEITKFVFGNYIISL